MSCLWEWNCANAGNCDGCLRIDGRDKYKPKHGERCPVCSELMEKEEIICKDCLFDLLLLKARTKVP